jgi:hypothetical protein
MKVVQMKPVRGLFAAEYTRLKFVSMGTEVGAVLTHRIKDLLGGAIAEAVSRWLPTVAARVRSQVWSSGISGGQSGAGAGFLRVLRFSLLIFIPPNNSPSSQSPGAGTIGQ